jgi:hypothetical protein
MRLFDDELGDKSTSEQSRVNMCCTVCYESAFSPVRLVGFAGWDLDKLLLRKEDSGQVATVYAP